MAIFSREQWLRVGPWRDRTNGGTPPSRAATGSHQQHSTGEGSTVALEELRVALGGAARRKAGWG